MDKSIIKKMIRDSVYFIFRYILRYRKNIIDKNLQFIFPGSSNEQLKKHFYLHIANLLSDALLGSKKKLLLSNPEILDEYIGTEKPIIIAFSHYSDWELAAQLPLHIKQPCVSAYKPLKNHWFNQIVRKKRQMWGLKMVDYRKIIKHIMENKNKNNCYLFLVDQYPTHDQSSNKVKFFNHDIRYLSGVEKIAKKINCPVFYLHMGKSDIDGVDTKLIELAVSPAKLNNGQLTQKIAAELELQIKNNPALWLWSHKRFKDHIKY